MKKELDLGKDSINKLLISFAIPCVISMLINSVYNIVDQIFIGQGVGTLGNAATNVIFPLVIICNAISGLIGNGCSSNLSLKLGEGDIEGARKSVGSALTVSLIVSVLFAVLSFVFLPKLVYVFGCTDSVYQYALDYGRIILIGAPFMIMYSILSSIIRSDGSPAYSMKFLVIGAIINIILDPIFIFGFKWGVRGGAIATVIGQVISFIIAALYIPRMKSIKIEKRDFIPNNSIKRTLSLGISSCITQLTVLALFIFMNNIMTKFGGSSKFGSDIPLSVYGVASKINSLFISSVLGIAIGSQPIIGFNYGAGYYDRVKMTMRKVLTINFIIGIIFNLAFVIFPKQLIGIFISPTDPSYDLFIEFAVLLFRTFLVVSAINALEMSTSTMLQSLGNVVSATAVSFIRQIILFIPIALILCIGFNKGIYGALYAGPIADTICFIICIFVFRHEYVSVGKNKHTTEETHEYKNDNYNGKKIIITISREYGSGGRYVGELLARKLGINFYDKEIITLASKESGLSESYVEETDEKKNKQLYANNNDDRIFIAEKKVIEDLASKESFVIVGRCADYILKDNKDTFKVFIYSDDENKVNRAVKYYGLNKNNALKEINKINKDRSKHYKYYTNREWYDFNNYDISINSDSLGIESTVDLISNIINSKLSD